jgi:hypothetical protein
METPQMIATDAPAVNTPSTPTRAPASRSTTSSKSEVPFQEVQGEKYFNRLIAYITRNGGKFLRNDEGDIFVVLDAREILLSRENVSLAGLMFAACNVSTVLAGGKIAIQRLLVHAQKAASETNFRQFSAVSWDEKRVYIPVADEKLLQISEENVQIVPNFTNADSLWVKHPKGRAFTYAEGNAHAGLARFEELLVETLPCKHSEMRWFLAMHEGLFPLVRDFRTSQFLVVHRGATQQGKTSGAQRFNLLHGLGEVTGDASIAALSAEGDVGFLALDNKEQENLNPSLIEYLLFLATGAGRKRASNDGLRVRTSDVHRPAVVVTSIEGVNIRAELRERCVDVDFCVNSRKVGRETAERAISEHRDEMISALVPVLQRFLAIRRERRDTPNPFAGNFDAHFTALCDLLRAFAEVAGKPDGWAEQMIAAWDRIIRQRSDGEEEESELEYHVRDVLLRALPQDVPRKNQAKLGTRTGTLYIVNRCAFLLNELQKRPGLLVRLPRNPNGLSSRLTSEKFRGFQVLRDADAPEHKELKRKAGCRPIGFFIPNDDVTVNDDPEIATVIGANP